MTLHEEAIMLLDEVLDKSTDETIRELVEEAIKRFRADHDALVAEHADLEGVLVRVTSDRERDRIAATEPDVQWRVREPDWRGDDFYEGATE